MGTNSSSSSNGGGSELGRATPILPPGLRLANGLQCRIGRARVAVPIESVARVIDYPVVPLPLARPWIGGLGLHEGTPLLSVALADSEGSSASSGVAKGILLHAPGTTITWALQIHEVFTFVRVTVQPRRADAPAEKLPRWITGATTESGQTLGWLDVTEMLAELERVGGQP